MSKNDEILEKAIGDIGGEEHEGATSLGKAKYYGKQREKNTYNNPESESNINDSGINIRNGWIEMDRTEMGERGQFYPRSWRFYIKPASVDDIKNWSSIDEERLDQVNDVFNEIIKSCVKITSDTGNISWGKINSWDRFWILNKVREYTFATGESKIQYEEECQSCNQPVSFELTSNSLVFVLPQQDLVDQYFDAETKTWTIDPKEYDINGPVLKFYVPTLEKDDVIFKWALEKSRTNKKQNETFIKFLPWMLPRATRDDKVNEKLISDAEATYKMWGVEMFSLADDIIRNIGVEPSEKLRTICPHCGEEVISDVRFPNGIRSLFSVQSGRKKFGQR